MLQTVQNYSILKLQQFSLNSSKAQNKDYIDTEIVYLALSKQEVTKFLSRFSICGSQFLSWMPLSGVLSLYNLQQYWRFV